MAVDHYTLKGRWNAVLRDELGNKKDERWGNNVITEVGKEFLASFLNSAVAGASTFTMRYVAVGSDTTAEAASNTVLGAEINRLSGVVSYISNQIFQVKATFAAGSATGAVSEYGLFSTITAGTMLSRDTESIINVGASDTLEVTCQITIV
jgi:hypothetical protein